MKHKALDVAVLILILSIGFFFFYLIRNNEYLKQQVIAQEIKASTLIREVGQTKDENNALFREINESNQQIESLRQAFLFIQGQSKPSRLVASNDLAMEAAKKIPRPEEVAEIPILTGTKNFLLIGQNSLLADTMIIAIANPRTQKVTLINIPRDLYVNGRKLNEYLSLYGIDALKKTIEETSGIKLDGWLMINFRAFERIIDALGGIDVNVPKNIYDSQYPDGRGGYIVYSVAAGMRHMNGRDALRYARSRHSTSDFDRSFRQQEILFALKEKMSSLGLLQDAMELQKIFEALIQEISTDVSIVDAVQYAIQFKNFAISSGNIISTANFLYSTVSINGQYILLPKSGNFVEMQNYIKALGNSN